jgi:hypothetical protein
MCQWIEKGIPGKKNPEIYCKDDRHPEKHIYSSVPAFLR